MSVVSKRLKCQLNTLRYKGTNPQESDELIRVIRILQGRGYIDLVIILFGTPSLNNPHSYEERECIVAGETKYYVPVIISAEVVVQFGLLCNFFTFSV